MDEKLRNGLPQRCMFVNGDGEIRIIEYGNKGFIRSDLNTENRKANHIIVKDYNEKHGITSEQVKMMHTGALLGWDTLYASHPSQRLESSMKNGHIFEVEISRPGSLGAETATTLALPAIPYEILDALDKARITDDRVIYSMEILSCELDYLPQFISPSVNLYELNHLAGRLSSLSQWELDCFEGMVMMDTLQTQYAPIDIDRLINMTHSMEHCQIAYEAHNDQSLGKFYADNDFVPKLENLSDEVYACLDFGKIGKEMREGEGGVFTPHGYVVQNGEIAKTYQNGEAIPLEKPDYTVLLRITKGHFNDPEYDNDLVALLKLPANDKDIYRAVEAVEAASPEECAFSATDCIVPYLTEKISDELYASEGDRYGAVNELAQKLRGIAEENSLPTYKAMLETAPQDLSLEEAIDLAEQVPNFRLLREIPSPLEYAQAELLKHDIPLKDELINNRNLYNYGQKLMESQGAVNTDYGILLSEDGMTVDEVDENGVKKTK
ncbi:hypothetical protein Dhaf_2423 [Desulfitobacterium hafniense DCB-2]|uniref:Uncharacterized protein n=1 Tax=Desulfitobacterium hafniense (strain DSM 10664 / DCB-2) TaxID=272564 RepID=B8FU37_DESHD|nr:hypothetical protein [Desulfitobacterium hafniense]ACL20451.1 hypothetical protein Dhaf_2423 [Desulfitobacterium hafniense DCB-2]